MFRGTIRMLDDRGFGFIGGERQDVFFDQSAIGEDIFRLLAVGNSVEYELVRSADPCFGVPQACVVRVQEPDDRIESDK